MSIAGEIKEIEAILVKSNLSKSTSRGAINEPMRQNSDSNLNKIHSSGGLNSSASRNSPKASAVSLSDRSGQDDKLNEPQTKDAGVSRFANQIPERGSSSNTNTPFIPSEKEPTTPILSPRGQGENMPLPIIGTPPQFSARTHSKPDQKQKSDIENTSKLTTTLNVMVSPYKIQIKKGNPSSTQFLVFTFKISLSSQVLGFIEKGRVQFFELENAIRTTYSPEIVASLGPFPEKQDFAGNSNGKQTGVMLQSWIANALVKCIDFPPLLEFLQTDIVQPQPLKESFRKNGPLAKKGNYFGGWKIRHFNLDSSSGTIFYADANQSEILGSFSLQYAYAIALVLPKEGGGDGTDKPGFVVSEYKKSHFNSPVNPMDGRNADGLPSGKIDVRHVLYAENVAERDSWVRCLAGVICKLRPNDPVAHELFQLTSHTSMERPDQRDGGWTSQSPDSTPRTSQTSLKSDPTGSNPEMADRSNKSNDKIKIQAEMKPSPLRITRSATAPSAPKSPSTPTSSNHALTTTSSTFPSDTNENSSEPPSGKFKSPRQTTAVGSTSVPDSILNRSASKHVDDQTRCMQQATPKALVAELDVGLESSSLGSKSRSKPGNAKGTFSDWVKRTANNSMELLKDRKGSNSSHNSSDIRKPLFGVTIQDAVAASPIKVGVDIPAIVYRCIEYLEAKNAAEEEGLYRLSGASSVITALKARFEEEGDVYLLNEDYQDPHAIAGLLKLFFREISEPLFTFQLRPHFFQAADLPDRDQKIAETTKLVQKLPSANYACLRTLLGHLIRVVQRSEVNKMTVRNIAIVFSPTLGVPAGLFTLMMAEYPTIFHKRLSEFGKTVKLESDPELLGSEEVTNDIVVPVKGADAQKIELMIDENLQASTSIDPKETSEPNSRKTGSFIDPHDFLESIIDDQGPSPASPLQQETRLHADDQAQ